MKGFIKISRNIGGMTLDLLVHYTRIYKESSYWKFDGKTIDQQDDEQIKELIKQAQ